MTKSIERTIKDQFAEFFEKKKWNIFKESADYYFETAAKIKTTDIMFGEENYKLLRRNVIKRLFIGIGCELLLKAIYLKNGYCINKKKQHFEGKYPFEIESIKKNDFKDDETLSFDQLISKLFTINNFEEQKKAIEKGLRISKVFRNKEGHVAINWHSYDPQNYRDIEQSII
ncbi:MAG TPA: hypothetical protein ENI02_00230, partial [Candidatus Aminicenantes bacterium]|nr:hypothetical protein [Candidatus Aminicenantes bacterium]